MSVWKAAKEYAAIGWRVVPLHHENKHPRLDDWPSKASCDEDVISGWEERWPNSNIGVQLGPGSGIIDIECDGEEEEATFKKIIGEDAQPTPTFVSVRGKHRLYQFRNDLPTGKAVIYPCGVGCRIGVDNRGAFSVFPPSTHPSGAKYRWLVSPSECDVAPITESMFAWMWNFKTDAKLEGGNGKAGKSDEEWEKILGGVSEGQRNTAAASYAGKLLASCDVFDPKIVETIWGAFRSWNFLNKPPLDEKELRSTFDSIWSAERNRRTAAAANEDAAKVIGAMKQDPSVVDSRWDVIRVTSDPPIFKLASPLWEGRVKLNSEDYCSWPRVTKQVVDQVNVYLPKSLKVIWEGGGKTSRPSLAQTLLASSTKEDAPPEEQRPWVIKRMIYRYLSDNYKQLNPGDEYDARGNVCVDQRGDYVFGFDEMAENLRSRFPSMDIKYNEITAILRQYGGCLFVPRIEGKSRRLRRIRAHQMAQFEKETTFDGLDDTPSEVKKTTPGTGGPNQS